jgi:hypothetical protein
MKIPQVFPTTGPAGTIPLLSLQSANANP